jgi:hypothetical protein
MKKFFCEFPVNPKGADRQAKIATRSYPLIALFLSLLMFHFLSSSLAAQTTTSTSKEP